MRSQLKDKQIQIAKKMAAKGEAGLFFGTLFLAIIIIFNKIWRIIKYPTFKVVTTSLLCIYFIVGTSFIPVTIMDVNEEAVEYETPVLEAELESSEYIRTEVSVDDDLASLDDLISGLNDFTTTNITSPEDSIAITEDEEDIYSRFNKNDWNLLLVNKQHPIPDDYIFSLGTIKGSMKCDERILVNLTEMFAGAAKDGVNLVVCSPYRDLSRQEYLFDRKMKTYIARGYSYIDAYKEASAVVTVPGASEHQIGLSLDIISSDYSRLDEGFGETLAGLWLRDNSYKYGFVLRYPKEKEEITGIIYEPWHFRYVGTEAATVMYENNLTLEEFIEKL